MFDKHKGSKQVGPETPENPVSKPAPSAAPASPPGSGKQTMIGSGISIAGDVTADSDLKVEGVIEGRSIESSHDVEIGESGKVTASITAKVVRIAGEVTGDVAGSEKVLISKSGRVHGNVAAPRVQLEDGALAYLAVDQREWEDPDDGELVQVAGDRIVAFEFDATPCGERRVLLAELTGRHSNLLLLGPSERCSKSWIRLKTVSGMSAVTPGSPSGHWKIPWAAKPPPNKLSKVYPCQPAKAMTHPVPWPFSPTTNCKCPPAACRATITTIE